MKGLGGLGGRQDCKNHEGSLFMAFPAQLRVLV